MRVKYYHESFEYNDDFLELGEEGLVLNAERILCPTCNGYGHHFRSDLDENAMVDSFREDGDDDGYSAYRGGAFDQRCEQCNGNKVVDEPIWNEAPKWVQECIGDWYENKRIDAEVYRAECGYQW